MDPKLVEATPVETQKDHCEDNNTIASETKSKNWDDMVTEEQQNINVEVVSNSLDSGSMVLETLMSDGGTFSLTTNTVHGKPVSHGTSAAMKTL